MSCSREEIVNEANKYIGVNEANETFKIIIDGYNTIKPLPRNYRVRYSDPWGATFISFIAKKCKALNIIPVECSCGKMIVAAYNMGIFHEGNDYKPMLGDIILYNWNDNSKGDCAGYPDHIGIVSQLTATDFTIIEGNKSGMVSTRTLAYYANYITGFIVPKYSKSSSTLHQTTDLEKLVRLVIRGDYGNGPERVSQLTRLGYDADEVHAKLDEILGS